MPITFPKIQAWDDSTDVVTFPADSDGQRIKCWISWEALQDHFKGFTSPLDAFCANRSRIESKAEQFILANRLEPDGSVGIRSADF